MESDQAPEAPEISEAGQAREAAEIDGYRVLGVRAAPATALGEDFDGGEEYDAHDPDSDRPVILRMLREAGTKASDLARLRREAKTLAELAHPNVVKAYGLGVHQGRLFIVLEAAAGEPLDGYIAVESPSWRRVVELFVEAGRGLAAAHARALVHRAIQPQALVVDSGGRGRIGGFGLGVSPWNELASPHEAPIEVLRVMAPENLRGRPATIYSDQLVFCVALWQAVANEHPLVPGRGRAPSRDALLDALSSSEAPHQPPTMPRRLRRLWRAVAPALHPDPARRYGSMHELLGALEMASRPFWRIPWPGG